MNISVPADQRVKIKEKRDKYLDLDRELDYNWGAQNSLLVRGLEKLEIGVFSETITKMGQNSEKSTGDLRRLAVTQTPVKDHQLDLVWKNRKQ